MYIYIETKITLKFIAQCFSNLFLGKCSVAALNLAAKKSKCYFCLCFTNYWDNRQEPSCFAFCVGAEKPNAYHFAC